jgi:hypothetical protein
MPLPRQDSIKEKSSIPIMSAQEDYELRSTHQQDGEQDLDPLLPPQYKDVNPSEDAGAGSQITSGLHLGGHSAGLYGSSRAARHRSFLTSVALTGCTLLVLIMAAPLFILWKNGLFSDGGWKHALVGSARPSPNREAFPTE